MKLNNSHILKLEADFYSLRGSVKTKKSYDKKQARKKFIRSFSKKINITS
jgi:hypothetical protein